MLTFRASTLAEQDTSLSLLVLEVCNSDLKPDIQDATELKAVFHFIVTILDAAMKKSPSTSPTKRSETQKRQINDYEAELWKVNFVSDAETDVYELIEVGSQASRLAVSFCGVALDCRITTVVGITCLLWWGLRYLWLHKLNQTCTSFKYNLF